MSTSISLGTAQFGIDYGITNTLGKVSENLVKEILLSAELGGIEYLDTAQDYGDAEEVIGRCKNPKSPLKIISKLSSLDKYQDEVNLIEQLEINFQKTLINLKCESINSFLIHRASDLKNKNSLIIWEWLESLKERRLIKKIGLSIYDLNDLENIPLNKVNIIQVPVSLYNQKILENRYLEKLSKEGILIHARSCFLQGLLLTKSVDWPKYISPQLRIHHKKTELIAKTLNISMLELSLGFIKKLSFLDSIIIGITNLEELNQYLTCWHNKDIKISKVNFKNLSWENSKEVDPRYWGGK